MGVNKASSAKRCELYERTALCNASEKSAPQAHEEKHEKIWHTANFLEHFFGTLPKNFLELSICKRQNYFFFCATIASK